MVNRIVLGVLAFLAPLAWADAWDGTFKSEKLTMQIRSEGGYQGTITLGDKSFPFDATVTGREMIGRFSDGDGKNSFPFSATLDNDTINFKTGNAVYKLTRATPSGANNPLERPDMNEKPGPGPGPVVVPQPVPQQSGSAVKSAQIEAAIKKAKEYLYSQQRNGHWDTPTRQPEPRPDAMGRVNVEDIQNSNQWGGVTAIVVYSLMAAGENPQDKRLAEAIEWLKKADISGTYALGMRAQIWNLLPSNRRKEAVEFAKRDRDLLLKNKRTDERYRGLFRYTPTDSGYDHSASQFAVLGMWACNQAGAEVPTEFWKEVEESWIRNQDATGGWNYGELFRPRQPVTPSMTAAGIATLFITFDQLHADAGLDCKGNASHKQIDAAIKWINKNYDQAFSGNWPFYTLYGMERIGLASGYKYLGTIDWYRNGADKLIAAQQPNGSWGGMTADTCFSVLFLVRGRNPVVMNKLQYDLAPMAGDKPKDANWNQRPRDAANITRWISKQLERELNWQIVNLRGPVEDLHDAPILYIAGNQVLNFTPQDEEKLRLFVQQGGMILGHADCSHVGFASSFKKLGAKLFSPYEFRELPTSHIIFSNLFDRKKWRGPMTVQGLSNGARELMILLPAGDPARFWQTGAYGGHEPAHELIANLFMYLNDKRDLRFKGDSWVVLPDEAAQPSATLPVARLQYEGNWNPEPGGWRQLAAVLLNGSKLKLDVQAVKLGEGKLSGVKVAHLTAGSKMKLTDSQRAEVKAFIDGGGTLIVDAAGGNSEAAASLESELTALAPNTKPEFLKPDHAALANLGMAPEEIAFRPYAAKTLGRARGPRVRGITVGNRLAILYSSEDLSVGLVGQPVDGITGYNPASATAIMRSLLVFAANNR